MSNNLNCITMNANVQITANKKEFKNGQNGYEVLIEGMEGKLQCKMNFTNPLKAMRYMFLLSKRLELQVDNIQLAALSLAYKRAKEAEAKAVADAQDAVSALNIETELESEQEAQAPQSTDADAQSSLFPEEESPSIKSQFDELKAKHPDALLLFRCGDFYESYDDDAESIAKVLGVTLTRRNSDKQRMAGFPYHALDTYLPKLIRAGHRVAICDAITPSPKRTKRQVTDLVSPSNESAK